MTRRKPTEGRVRRVLACAAMAMVVFSIAGPIRAEERVVTMARSGDWIALQHRMKLTGPPDMCVAGNTRANVVFRFDGTTVDVRVIDKKWSLPTGVDGEIVIAVGDWKTVLKISSNDATTVDAEISEKTYPVLFAAMDKASAMTVTIGKAKPLALSLIGSAKVMNAFRACAGINGTNEQGGENPFS